MGLFAYMYYHSFIAVYKASVGSVMELAITGLTYEEQIEVVKGLSKYLYNQDAVSEKVSPSELYLQFGGLPSVLNYLADVTMYLSRTWEQHEEMTDVNIGNELFLISCMYNCLEMTWNRT